MYLPLCPRLVLQQFSLPQFPQSYKINAFFFQVEGLNNGKSVPGRRNRVCKSLDARESEFDAHPVKCPPPCPSPIHPHPLPSSPSTTPSSFPRVRSLYLPPALLTPAREPGSPALHPLGCMKWPMHWKWGPSWQRCAQKAPRVALGSTRPWPTLRSLLHRNLVLRTHQPARYSLSPEGLELAQKLAESEGLSSLDVGFRPEEPPGKEPEVPGAASAELGASEGSVQQLPLDLGPGEYRVLLWHRPELLLELQRLHVTHVVCKLHVGDFVWVAQETRPRDPARPGELILDHIVEHKRLDDLCSSIIDGHFPEQKFWLKRCGLGHRVHLVEEHGSANHLSLPEGALLQAVTNTQVIDGFFVKRTADLKESAAYLALLTRGFRPWGTSGDPESRPGPSPHPVCSLLTFSDFNAGAMKNKAQCVCEVFARQLMQVRGVTPLPASYDACVTPKEQEMLLSTINRIFSQLYCCYSPLT
ncbi:unnamed protein product [Nyctereutes procyonoides]|uniref:Crossover junction endonuclease MUS81 n=1 Tax=Nyctereutes procyonoides TaxID=34880 RepID=A0A811YXQ8_NYCPR|nr:unnamed protein product [Nyctereutes procyonoides]